MAEKGRYEVLWHLGMHGKTYEPGEIVLLTAEEAASLSCVKPAAAASKKKPPPEEAT